MQSLIIRCLFLLFLILTSFRKTYSQRIFYVKENANGDGSSWKNATGDLQEAINMASDGDQVWVTTGSFYPNRSIHNLNKVIAKDRTMAFVIMKNIKLYGGFSGNESNVNQIPNTNLKTTLNGDIGILKDNKDNCYHVLICSPNAKNAEIRGFSIINGYADRTETQNILPDGTTIIQGQGGGIAINGGSLIFNNLEIGYNHAINGGGINVSENSNVTFDNITLLGNEAEGKGGGIHINSANCTIRTSIVIANRAAGGGGVANENGANLKMIGCSIQDNKGIFSGKNPNNDGLVIYGPGGGILNLPRGSAEISHCQIKYNDSFLLYGGGISNQLGYLKLSNVLIFGNNAIDAGGLDNRGTCDATNITMANNGMDNGGVITGFYSSFPMNLSNSIIWDNILTNSVTSNTHNCLIKGEQGNASDIDGHLWTQDQIFLSAAVNDYHLLETSPAINMGDNDLVDSEIDLDNKSRIYNKANGGIVDLGAYEYQGEKQLLPFNEDNIHVTGFCTNANTYFIVDNFDRDSIQWNLGDGNNVTTFKSNSIKVTHEYEKPSNYKVIITVFSRGRQDIFTKSIDIQSVDHSLGKDTAICPNTTISLLSKIEGANFLWQDNSTLSSLQVNKAGLYWLDVTKNGCSVRDTIIIKELELPQLIIVGNKTFCEGDSIELKVEPSTFKNILWNNSFLGDHFMVGHAGSYDVEATAENTCIFKSKIQINTFPYKDLTITGNREFCEGDSIKLSVDDLDFKDIIWNNTLLDNTIVVKKAGVLKVKATTENGCISNTEIIIHNPYSTPNNFLPKTIHFCENELSVLKPSNVFTDYQWSDGSTMPSLIVKKNGKYLLSVKDQNGCKGLDSSLVTMIDCNKNLFFPNAFTPNQDGVNDKFGPINSNGVNVISFKLMIYNRWGNLIFNSNNITNKWNGEYNGKLQPLGTYIWLCTYQLQGVISSKSEKGTILLMN